MIFNLQSTFQTLCYVDQITTLEKEKNMYEVILDVIIFVLNRKNVTILMSSKPPSRFSLTFIFYRFINVTNKSRNCFVNLTKNLLNFSNIFLMLERKTDPINRANSYLEKISFSFKKISILLLQYAKATVLVSVSVLRK